MKSRRRESGIFKISCIILLVSVLVLFAGCKKKMTFQDYLDLGDKYLLELNYEEAAVAFNKAIELEPRDPQSYLKLAKVYDAKEDYEMAVQILMQGYDATGDGDVKKQKEIYENLISHEDLIQEGINRMKTADKDSIWQLQSGDEYQSFISKLDRVIKRDCGDGNWFLIYPCGHCYYGGMEEGKRSGQGSWCMYDYVAGYAEYASSTWKDDYPNGTGEGWSMRIAVPEQKDYFKASFKDGLYHGIVEKEYIDTLIPEEFIDKTYPVEYTDGVPEEVEDTYGRGNHTEGGKERFCIYSDEEMNFFAIRGKKYGMAHARKETDSEQSMVTYSMEDIKKGKHAVEEERWDVMSELQRNLR